MGCSNNGKANNGKPRPQRLAFLLPFFFLILLFFISPIHAESDVNFQDIPEKLAEALGMPLFASQILASGFVLLMVILPIVMLTRGSRQKASWIAELVVGLVFMGFCIAIEWLPFWFLLILCMLIALMFARDIREMMGGK